MAGIDLKRSAIWAQLSSPNAPLFAIEHLRRLRGGTQAHLLRSADGDLYLTKFKNNPVHVRILANEFLATRLALSFGLPMPQVAIIEVSDWLISHTPKLRIQIGETIAPCSSGLQFASRYIDDCEQTDIFERVPERLLARVINTRDFLSILPFDKWVGNCDARQAIFRKRPKSQYEAVFVDQSYCFNAGQWTFPDLPLMGAYESNFVYRDVTGWDSFEPMLSQIEQVNDTDLWKSAIEVPQEWYQYDAPSLSGLIETLYMRRGIVRDLITRFRNSVRNPFPKWTARPSKTPSHNI